MYILAWTYSKLKEDDFLPCVESIVTAGDFKDMTEGAQTIFI
jgi:roadblock/LC7 domain-containing protein